MFPRWLSLLVVGMMLYLLYTSQHAPEKEGMPSPQPVTQEATADAPTEQTALPETFDPEYWKKKINPDYAAQMGRCELSAPAEHEGLWWRMTEEKPGAGAGVRCGEEMLATLTLWDEHGKKRQQETVKLTLGKWDIAAGIDAALLGMKPGAVRTVMLVPGTYARGEEAAKLPKGFALAKDRVTVITAERVD